MAKGYGNIGLVYHDKGRYDDVLIYHEKALAIYKQLKDKWRMIQIFLDLALTLLTAGQQEKAESVAKNVLQIAQEFQEQTGSVYQFTDEGEEILERLKVTYKHLKKID